MNNRIIKFRAWNGKEMRYGVGIGNYGNPIRNGYQWFNEENDVHNSEPLQYTGLQENNGKDIYEGDIIKWEDSLGRLFVYPVTWHNYKSGFILDSENFSLGMYKRYKVFEVIGNIYENPELLKYDS